jgi:hypothetical protein
LKTKTKGVGGVTSPKGSEKKCRIINKKKIERINISDKKWGVTLNIVKEDSLLVHFHPKQKIESGIPKFVHRKKKNKLL